MKQIISFGLIGFLLGLAGCSTWNINWKKHLPWSPQARLWKSDYEAPSRLVTIWTPDILTQPGKPPTRGFGGRLYFYNSKSHAIPVEGQLLVYAYDDTPDEQSTEPDRKFAFTPDQFTKHFAKSDLGASYSIWLPWDAVGGEQKSISLVPVFTASSGQIVMGQQAMNVLPGTSNAATRDRDSLPPQRLIQPVSHTQQLQHLPTTQQAGNGASEPVQNLRTTTITLPRSMQQRMAHNACPTLDLIADPSKNQWGQLNVRMETVPALPAAALSEGTANANQPPVAPQAMSPALSRLRQPSTRFARYRPQVPTAPNAQSTPVDDRMTPSHAAPPFDHRLAPPPSEPIQGQAAWSAAAGIAR